MDGVLQGPTTPCWHHVVRWGQDWQDELLIITRASCYLSQIMYLLLANGHGLLRTQTIQVYASISVLAFVHFVENLPRNVPENLLLCVIILFSRHWLGVLTIIEVPIQVLKHFSTHIVVFLSYIKISLLTPLHLLLSILRVLASHLEVRWYVLIHFNYFGGPKWTICVYGNLWVIRIWFRLDGLVLLSNDRFWGHSSRGHILIIADWDRHLLI